MSHESRPSVRGRRRRGASTVEYASLLLIGAAILAGGSRLFEGHPRDTFNAIPQAMGGKAHSVQASIPRPTDRLAHAERASPPHARSLLSWWSVCTLFAGGGLGLWAAHFLRRRALARQAAKENPSEQIVPEHVQAQFVRKRQGILQVLDREMWSVFEGRVLVRGILTRSPVAVSPTTGAAQIKELMQTNSMRHVLVCDANGKVVGVVSDRDLGTRRGATAADIMTRDLVTVGPDVPVTQAVSMMLGRSISCLPVVEGGKLVGVVTSTDIMMTLQCCLQLLKRLAAAMRTDTPNDGTPPSGQPPRDDQAATTDGAGRFFELVGAPHRAELR